LSRPRKVFVERFLFTIFLSILDIAAVTPALAAMMKQYHLSFEWSVWAISLHLAFFSFSLPLLESWSMRVGRQTVLHISLVIFALGSLISAISEQWLWFISGRVIQAIGMGGVVLYVAFQMQRETDKRKRRAHVLLSTWIIFIPILATILVQFASWKALFLLNLPISLCVYLFSKRLQVEGSAESRHFFDGVGLLFFSILLLFLLLAITLTPLSDGWHAFTLPSVIPLWMIAFGMIVPLWMVERQNKYPLFAPHLFAHWRLWLLYIQVTLSGFCWMGLIFVPIWVLCLFHVSIFWYGYILSLILCWSIFGWWIIYLLSNKWDVKITSMLGFFCAASAYFLLTWLQNEWSLLIVILLGIGLSLVIATPFHQLLFYEVPPRYIRNGLMVMGMFRSAGGALGLVTMARLFSSYDPMVTNWFVMGGPADESITWAIRHVMYFAAFASCLGLIWSVWIPRSTAIVNESKKGR
jgi:MFS family permease